jgi:hypothetical protein
MAVENTETDVGPNGPAGPLLKCPDKEWFATRLEADQRAWFAVARSRDVTGRGGTADRNDIVPTSYRCRRCSGYHVRDPQHGSLTDWSITG